MNTSLSLQLDPRQRAMLAEMGVRVWAPALPAQHPSPPAPLPHPCGAGPAPKPMAAQAPAAPPLARPTPGTHALSPPQPHALGVESMDWATLRQTVSECQACGLCRSRTQTVFGSGSVQAHWMIVGEAPGETEDRLGEPFVGVSGQLLDQMLHAVGRSRTGQGTQGVYISNVLKCRPPANRNPQAAEVAQCEPYLARQVALVQPKVILAMGRFAIQSLLQTQEPVGKLRSRVHRYQGIPVIATYHPAYLLRTPSDKGKAWADFCLALSQETPD